MGSRQEQGILNVSSTKSVYWKGVASRLATLGKAALNLAAPVAIEVGVGALISKACDKIELKLKELYKKTAINSGITFLINLVGILILALRPFGESASAIVAVVFFAAAAVFFWVRVILWCRSYGTQTVVVTKSVLQEKSLHTGIEKYVLSSFPFIALTYAGIDVGAAYVPALKTVPRIPQLIDFFVGYFWKRVALFTGIVTTYTVIVFWVVRPVLVKMFW